MAAEGNAIVAAYLDARAEDERIDASGMPNDDFIARKALFTLKGAEYYAMAFGIHEPEHGALVALLAAERLQLLIDGSSIKVEGRGQMLPLGIEERYEVRRILDALLNLSRHLDRPSPRRALDPLAKSMHLIDANGNAID